MEDLTDEERESIGRFFTDMIEGVVCPQCLVTLTGQKQVGRCVYAEPCGHRLYQGKVNKKWRKADRT